MNNNYLLFLVLSFLMASCSRIDERQFDNLQEIVLASECLESPDGAHVFFYKYLNDVVWRHDRISFTNYTYVPGMEYRLLVSQIGKTNSFVVVKQLESVNKKSVGIPHLSFDPTMPADCITSEIAYPNERERAIQVSPNVYKLDSLFIVGSDIVMTEEDYQSLITTKAGYRKLQYWSSGVVHYTYASGFSYANLVQEAISEWTNKTGLSFVYGTDNKGYIEFFNGNGPYSTAEGKAGGKQRISLDASCSSGNAMHEIGHATGLIHEHCRPDRDSYIIIYDNNIINGEEDQFEKFSWYEASPFGSMDDNSIMMYGSWAFSRNTLPTIKHIDGTFINQQRDSLSVGDVECIKSIYGPPYHKLTSSRTVTRDEVSGIYEYYYYYDTYTLSFYQDENLTIPTSLQYSRPVSFYRQEYYYDSNTNSVVLGVDVYNITVPSGVSSYNVGSIYSYEKYALSDPTYGYSVKSIELF